MNEENNLKEKINEYERIKARENARKQRFLQRRKELGYNHISSLWVHLNPDSTEILKQGLKNASEEQLLSIINFLESKIDNDNNQENKWSTRALLKNELVKYIKLKQNNKKIESLNDLSIRLMNMGIFTESRKNNKKVKFSTGSLSRMLKRIKQEVND